MTVIMRYVPMTYDEYTALAGVLHTMTVEEVVDLVNQMPSDAEEWTQALPGGAILTLRKRKRTNQEAGMTTKTMNRITVREGEKPLLPMDGTGDDTKLWLFDPNQMVFFRFESLRPPSSPTAYRREGKSWLFQSFEPGRNWEPVAAAETIKLLEEMHEALVEWRNEIARKQAEAAK